MNGLQLESRESGDSQVPSTIQLSKESSGNVIANESITKRKNPSSMEPKQMSYSKMTVLLEGIEALGKPPVSKADLHKLFKPFNVDFNDIIVKNNKDCAFVEVNPDKCKPTFSNQD